MSDPRTNVAKVMVGLKDFQRTSVDYVFRRMYTDADPTRRFLLADEVGLGKTMVAKGVVAKTIEHLRAEGVPRIDVLYICSNLDIARQNIERLNVTPEATVPLASRITLLPKMVHDLKDRPLNFVTFTPGTSFNLRSSLGTMEERVMLHWMLREIWSLPDRTGPRNVLRGNVSTERFQAELAEFSWLVSQKKLTLDASLVDRFGETLEAHGRAARERGEVDIRERFDVLREKFTRPRQQIPPDEADARTRLVGELRGLLATACLEALEPDLIILDEFQRFRDLLDGEDDAATLARNLFEWGDARVLLLSATPYKMLTLSDEDGGEDHYQDFVRTYRFLSNDEAKATELQQLLQEFRRELLRMRPGSAGRLAALKAEIEERLRKVMCRTERLAMDESRCGMLRQVPPPATPVHQADLRRYVALQSVADHLDHGDTMEFWKSAPYPLNFMEKYELKVAVSGAGADSGLRPKLAKLFRAHPDLLLDGDAVAAYRKVDPGNARLRHLMDETVGKGAWRLLWLPPTLPYYAPPEGPFADPAAAELTKRLVFSCWKVVPKAVAALLSYEAERRMTLALQPTATNTPEARKRRRPLLRFARSDGRLTGMSVFPLVYPSAALAEMVDPLTLGSASARRTADEVLDAAEKIVAEKLRQLGEFRAAPARSAEDEAWYWAGPVLLDLAADEGGTRRWWGRDDLADEWARGAGQESASEEDESLDEGETRWDDHVEEARRLVAGTLPLGRPPADLARVLAEIALAAPATAALRALTRQTGGAKSEARDGVRLDAARIGRAFLSLFNQPEAMALIRSINGDEPYWRRVLEYALAGNLQATLDEYTHILREDLGVPDAEPAHLSRVIADKIVAVLALRTSTVGVDHIRPSESGLTWSGDAFRMRMRFAVRFGDEKSDDPGTRNRASGVRAAFNSPFWPFVLVSTSVGQEGLDFHPYCHAVVHWNLPSNPVDLEQREGRVHRYKGHAVRKNLARTHRDAAMNGPDPWAAMFAKAVAARPADSSDLVPFWLFPIEGGAQIERHVLASPLSRDRAKLTALRRSLAVYRMVFGQPRQEELMEYLLTVMPGEDLARMAGDLRMDLAPGGRRSAGEMKPPSRGHAGASGNPGPTLPQPV